MTVLLFIAAFVTDFVVAVMSGTTLYILWGWLIIPTFETIALSWNAAIMVAFVARFLTGSTTDVFNIASEDLWPLMAKVLGNKGARCVSYLILGAMLSFMV